MTKSLVDIFQSFKPHPKQGLKLVYTKKELESINKLIKNNVLFKKRSI